MGLRRLFVGMNRGAELAKKELEKHSVSFVIVETGDKNMEPVLVTSEGYFEGLAKIKEYVKYWAQMSNYGTDVPNSVYVS